MQIENQLYEMDCLDGLAQVPTGSIDLVFCDPPFNIGFDYGEEEYADNLPPAQYEAFSVAWLGQAARVLKADGTLWLAIGDEWAAELKVHANKLGFHTRSWVIWYYTFGVNCTRKFTRSHAHLFHFVKDVKSFTFNHADIRVPSARQVVYGDKRANPAGRLPDDTWVLRPQELPEGFPADGDVWTIPRICGTYKQRQEGAANQMPEQLMGRIIRACSNAEDIVLDPMAGTGTTLVTAKKLNRKYLGFEVSKNFTQLAKKRIRAARPGDPLDGAVPHGG